MTDTKDALINPAGQETSPLVREVMERYGIEQGEVAFREEGAWVYCSESSAVVAVETTERTCAKLEYGQGDAYDRVQEDLDLHYIHIFYLAELTPGVQYDLRVLAEDRRGRRAESGVLSLQTRALPDAIRLPGQAPGPPYVLDQPGYYLLTEDVVAAGTALQISASHVVLDLGGHRVVYDEDDPGVADEDVEAHVERAAFGIKVVGSAQDVKILNGAVAQGRTGNGGSDESIGYNPLFADGTSQLEVAGLTCTYRGTQLSGVACRDLGPGVNVHHNVVEDLGKSIDNRHQMCSAIRLNRAEGGAVYGNLVKRARQAALGNLGKGLHVHDNELHIDSYSINSFGIGIKDDSIVHGNRIFGCGDNVVAMATTGGCRNIELYDNYIWLQAHDIAEYQAYLNAKEMESTPYSIMSGVRITWGCEDVEYRNNTILVTAREGGKVRGTFLYNEPAVHGAAFRHNLVIAIAEDEASDAWGAIAGVGNETRGPVEPMLFGGNTIVSNFANFNMQDTYGVSINYRFVGNTFVKVGDRADYATIKSREVRPSKGHMFLNSRLEGGAGYDQIDIGDEDEFTVQWLYELEAPVGADVTMVDAEGQEAFRGEVGDDGRVSVPLVHFHQVGSRRELKTPYAVTVVADGETSTVVCEPEM